MEIVLWILAILGVVFTPIAIFIGMEMVKKFNFMHQFATSSGLLRTWHFHGADKAKHPRGMRNVVLKGGESFTALIGFKLKLPGCKAGMDWYGTVKSNQSGVAVFSTYLGGGECDFQFLLDTPTVISFTTDDDAQKLVPSVSFPPHWWQRLGIYG